LSGLKAKSHATSSPNEIINQPRDRDMIPGCENIEDGTPISASNGVL